MTVDFRFQLFLPPAIHTSPPCFRPLQTHTSEAADTYGIDKQDVYGGSAPWLTEFETEVASTLGKEAALFCPSGVMAQLIALKIHATTAAKTGEARVPPPDKGGAAGTGEGGLEGVKPRGSFLCHPSSHILLHEEGAHEELLGFKAVSVGDIEVRV